MTSSTTPESLITLAKTRLGGALVILGHHYQKDEVIRFADYRGDSLKLARDAAACRDAKYIVFCGVRFMAETAAILANPGQVVILPEPEATCPLAEKADPLQVEDAWKQLGGMLDAEREIMPVTYVNSEAGLKAFCGMHGGTVCTSSNARAILEWARARRPRTFFFPDQHLGRNTGLRMGISAQRMPLWDPRRELGGNDREMIAAAEILLWKGWCYVHQRFLPAHVEAARKNRPGVRVWVHLECTQEVVRLSDGAGSTADIIRLVDAAPAGSRWAIGTEGNLVNRLAREHPEQEIRLLSPDPNNCVTMNKTTLASLARVAAGLLRGEEINPVRVPPDVAEPARAALDRMLEVRG
ncbi:MAG: quinolinate synthase NadA [Anaerolineales bacterium]|nr:quinolinate synthase NadA [Anaerolineales bacterium]